MSLPVREVGLEEGSILNLIGDYFEVAGHAECLLAVEHLCKDSETARNSLPLELAVLREIVLAGRWDQLMRYLDRFASAGDEEGLKKCRYLAHRQKFLEILHYVETDIQARIRLGFSYCENGELLGDGEAEKVRRAVEAQLATLDPFCPTRNDYNSLKMLLSLPCISSSKEFASWQLHSGRLGTMHRIQEWVSKTLYLDVKFPSSQEVAGVDRSCALLRLLAKGLLYEQCEELCRARCGEAYTEPHSQEQVSKMLDLRGWIQQQPDSSFQLPPSELSLMVSPWVKPSPPCLRGSQSIDIGAVNRECGLELRHNPTAAKSVSSILPLCVSEPAVPCAGKASAPAAPPNANSAASGGPEGRGDNQATSKSRASLTDGEENAKTLNADQVFQLQPTPTRVSRQQEVSEVSAAAVSAVSANPDTTAPKAGPGTHIPANLSAMEIRETQAKESRGAVEECTPPNYNEPDGLQGLAKGVFLPSGTPLRKTGRGSSTPKNIKASQASLRTSPPSSPIASNLVQGTTADVCLPAGKAVGQGARKRIDFNSWPKVTLLRTVTDPQAVRSVAFSESGKMVAIGANSGTLRLFDTASLVENKSSEEVDVLYQHSRFHRGSIYCLAWFGDSILASGSNDKTISLLTLSSDSGSSELSFSAKKPLPFHKGTIRDILFTRDGLLVYGGGVSPDVQVVDVRTYQNAVSLLGHSDQVLALDILPGGLLASSGQDKTVLLWDMRSPVPVSTLAVDSTVAGLTSSGNLLVTSHLDGSCAVYDLNMLKRLSTYSAHTQECRSVRYQPQRRQLADRRWVLSGSYDRTVCLTDTESLQWTKLCQHEDKVIQCRWHPEGNLFASTGADKKACIWSIGTA